MQQALTEIVVLFIILGFGIVLGKRGLVDEKMGDKLGSLVLSFTFPALIITSMDREFNVAVLRNSVIIAGITLALCMAILIAIELETRFRKNPPKSMSARHFLMMFGNTAFMGIPVLMALYGSDGVFYAVVMNVVFNFFMFSYGIFILCRHEHPNFKKIFLNAGFIGTAIGLVLFLTPLSLPYVVSRPLSWCGDMTIPLALLVAGEIISRNRARDIIRPVGVWYASVIRIVIFPVILIPMFLLLGVSPYIMGIVVIIFSTPAPLTGGAFIGSYGGDSFFANKVIVLSYILSLITMPVLIFIFTSIIV